MRCVVFPSYSCKDERPPLSLFLDEAEITIVAGPTESGLFLLEANLVEVELLKLLAFPFYILFEDFEKLEIH
jgi:hypothetical protein